MKTSAQLVGERWRQRDATTYATGRSAGALATQSWLAGRGLLVSSRTSWEVSPRTSWEVSIALDVIDETAPAEFSEAKATRFHIAISSTEWGFYFCHQGRASWIRITDLPFVHERDDHALLFRVPPLRSLGSLVRMLEETYGIELRREHASIRSTIPGSEPAIWEWVLSDI